ncbi:MAG: hypothetical protein A3E82_06430 [Gammaproteobacteria bacterium RIFCSPHIGHO2_12_FULL_38_11]|nr:MAG: hypothetical protein A3E82_06430 [Gammaproteobacteria bacterium RIFCSPHIGHO2_12_FULL_38_11]
MRLVFSKAVPLFIFLGISLSLLIRDGYAASRHVQLSETSHTIAINGKKIAYKATVGVMPIYNNKKQLMATMSYIAYVTNEGKNRPVTFVWCGGPGQSSLSENFYLSGPKIFNPKTKTLDNNPQTWLRYTDLVYIDMVGTGWGRPVSKAFEKEIYSTKGDAFTFTKFIENYLEQNNKINSPIYLVGESYGGTRAVLVAKNLLKNTIAINGMMLFSPLLNSYYMHPAIFGNDMPYVLSLPTLIRAALYHHKLNPKFQNNAQKTIQDGVNWALNQYPALLLKGDNLSQLEKTDLETNLKNYTGLSAELIRNNHYRISTDIFYKNILGNNKKIDYLDTRIEDYSVPFHNQYFVMSIKSLMKSQLALYPVAIHYIKNRLKFSDAMGYINYKYPNGWKSDSQYKQVLSILRSDMIINNHMKLFVGLGYFDADIPYMTNVVAINQLLLPEFIQKNIVVYCYDGGHMFYLNNIAIRKNLNDEVEKLYLVRVRSPSHT